MTNEIVVDEKNHSVIDNGVTYYIQPWENAFLTEFRTCASVRKACKIVGITRSMAYAHRAYSPPFARKWDEAREDSYDAVYEEAHRRAVYGVEKPVFFQGEEVGTITEYSDTLMAILLKGVKPEIFGNKVDVTSGGQTLNKPQVFLPELDVLEGEIIEEDKNASS